SNSGNLLGAVANIAGSALTGGMAAKPALDAFNEFPYNKTMEIRKAIPPWVASKSEEYGAKLDEILGKSATRVPVDKVSGALGDVVNNEEFFNKLNPRLQNKLQTLYDSYSNYREGSVDPKEVIDLKQAIRSAIPKNPRFDINESAISDITQSLGKAAENSVPGLKQLNSEYAPYAKLKQFANQTFQPWKSEYDTSKSEGVLGKYLSQPTGVKEGLSELGNQLQINIAKQARNRDIAKLALRGTEGLGAYEAARLAYDKLFKK